MMLWEKRSNKLQSIRLRLRLSLRSFKYLKHSKHSKKLLNLSMTNLRNCSIRPTHYVKIRSINRPCKHRVKMLIWLKKRKSTRWLSSCRRLSEFLSSKKREQLKRRMILVTTSSWKRMTCFRRPLLWQRKLASNLLPVFTEKMAQKRWQIVIRKLRSLLLWMLLWMLLPKKKRLLPKKKRLCNNQLLQLLLLLLLLLLLQLKLQSNRNRRQPST